jgi:DNA-binding winged helix-turn-helix (wHTH) protein
VRAAFDGLVLDSDRFALRRADEVVHVEPQVFEVLAYLVTHRDRVVTKEELLDAVWRDRFVSESALTSRIKAARQAVGDDGSAQRLIRTVHRRGYQFVAPVEMLDDAPVARPEPQSAPEQHIRMCAAADGTRLAYATVGSGAPLVRAAVWMTHLDYDFQSPVWRHMIIDLAAHRALIRYDERGCGLSDHDVSEFSLEAWVADLATVVDAAGLERFDLLGLSQGGAVSIAYAARNPSRVRRLVLLNAYAQGRVARARTDAERREAELQAEVAAVGWGRDDVAYRQFFASSFMPSTGPETWEAFAELQRRTTSADNAFRFMSTYARIDVSLDAARVQAPTLVLHSRDDRRVPFEQARVLASLVPNARLVPLESPNHLFVAGERAWAEAVSTIDEFLGDGVS